MLTFFEGFLGVKGKVVLAGTIGGLISLRFFEGLSMMEKIIVVLGGTASSVFGTPAAANYFQVPEDYHGGIGFVLGLFAMSLAGAVGTAIKDGVFKEIIRAAVDWLLEKMGKRPSQNRRDE